MKNICATLILTFFFATMAVAQSSGLQSLNNDEHPGYTIEQAKQLLLDDQSELTADGFQEVLPFPTLGEQIQEARIDKGVALENLAQVIGLDASKVASIEQGQVLPTRELLVRIQIYLDCELVIDAG